MADGNVLIGKYTAGNGTWTEHAKGTTHDGKSFKMTQSLTVSEVNQSHTWAGTMTIDGGSPDEIKTVWQRVYDPAGDH